ncbi:MAG: hypothetical protein D8M57_00010 [Candidatus Scalindua sp. AMX11]|nr:MAG: hypothetical protein DWQ00_18975 [Candidatus Scalindua sp.]TDE66811.1 MAG: hypothetical protein D8M57_00010 [Candidatus Scalindua sp. AMX11]
MQIIFQSHCLACAVDLSQLILTQKRGNILACGADKDIKLIKNFLFCDFVPSKRVAISFLSYIISIGSKNDLLLFPLNNFLSEDSLCLSFM